MKALKQGLGLLLFSICMAIVGTTVGAPSLFGAAGAVTPFLTNAAGFKSGYALYVSNPDVDALAAYAGKYEQKLYSTMINGMEFIDRQQIDYILNVKGKLRLTKLKITANVRPYSATEHLQGTSVYTERVLEVNRGKSEMEIEVLKYRDTWMNEVLKGAIDPNQIPFAEYFFNEYMREIGTEINNRTLYFGFDTSDAVAYDAGDAYAVGDYVTFTPAGGVLHYYKCIATASAGDTPSTDSDKWQVFDAEAFFPGFKYYIDEALTDGDLTEIVSGVVNSGSTALTAMKKVYRGLPAAYKNVETELYCSHTDFEYLLDGISDKFHQYTGKQEGSTGVLYLPDTDRKCRVMPVTWLSGSRRLIATPKANLVFGTNVLADFSKFNIVKSALWTVKMGVVFEGGVQIRDLAAMSIGDQD